MNAKQRAMRHLKPRAVSIRNREHPEWGTFGIMEDHGGSYEIHGSGGSRMLDKDEAARFWEVAPEELFAADRKLAQAIRVVVMRYMHYRGRWRDHLTAADWQAVYLRGDGVGYSVERDEAQESLGWSFDHVSHSSLRGLRGMLAELLRRVPNADRNYQEVSAKIFRKIA